MVAVVVVEFVAVKAPRSHRDQQGSTAAGQACQYKALISIKFNRFPLAVGSALGAKGRGFESLRPDHESKELTSTFSCDEGSAVRYLRARPGEPAVCVCVPYCFSNPWSAARTSWLW